MTEKKCSRNAQTEHSRALRAESAKASQKKLTAANRLEIRNQDAEKIARIKAGLASIAGGDNADKLIMVLRHYEQTT